MKFLAGWSGEGETLPARMVELAKAMAKEGFWGDADVALVEAWIKVVHPIVILPMGRLFWT